MELSLVLLVGCLLLSACAPSRSSPVSPPSTHAVPLVSTTNITGEGRKEFLFGLLSFPAEQAPLVVTTGHIALFEATVVLPLIIGFYFTPGGRR